MQEPSLGVVPQLDPSSVAQDEMEEARHINWLLRLLKSKEEDFESCMHLTIVCYRKLRRYGHLDWGYRLHQKWRDIAMQNAAHSIYHSGYILSGILKSVALCPTLKQRLDIQKLHTAQPTFKKYFPQSDRLRHAVAHSAEAVHTRADLAKNRTTGITEVGGLQIGGWSGGQIIIDYQIYMTHKGKVVSLDVTPETLGKLREVRSIIHEVFNAVRHPDPSRPPQPD